MTPKEFEVIRSYVSHSLLRNGIFTRLGADPSVIEGAFSTDIRIGLLVKSSLEAIRERGNIRKAARTWLSGDGASRPVKQEILSLITSARSISGLHPGSSFPNERDIEVCISQCDEQMARVDDMLKGDSAFQEAWFAAFWRGALVISDTVHSFGVHCSGRFWDMFRSETAS